MSTVILGRLSAPRQPHWQEAVAGEAGGETQHWTDALAAVIPGEALAAYIAMIAFFTVQGTGETSTLKDKGWVWGLTVVIWFLIPLAYASGSGILFQPKHVLRWSVAMVAFVVWLWLLPLSPWDVPPWDGEPWDTIKDLDGEKRAATGVVAAFAVVIGAGYLFKKLPLPS
jgi:hypothetical protein